jgi:hypothetical protein
MVGRAWGDGRDKTRHVILTICRSRDCLRSKKVAREGLCRTFCACQACNAPRFRSDVKHDGCLKPWNLEREKTCVERNGKS